MVFFAAACGTVILWGQEEPPSAAMMVGPPSKTDTLRSLLTTRDSLRAAVEEQRKKLAAATAETVKDEVRQEVERLEKRRQEVERDFAIISTGIRAAQDGETAANEPAPTLQQEIGFLLAPILSDIRELTRRPREVQALDEELRRLETARDTATRAMTELDRTISQVKPGKNGDTILRAALQAARKDWQGRHDEAVSRAAAVLHQLEQLRASDTGFWTGIGLQVREFVFTRGANIALALLAFAGVLYGLRGIYLYVLRLVPVHRHQRLGFTMRVLDVAHQGVSLVLAFIVALLVLYARGDWMLGGLALLGIGALLLTARSGFIRHMEQLRLLLNLGTVREGERVIISSVPWRVGKIHVFTQLTNDVIGGPGLRLPLEQLMTLASRPSALDEPWFPCARRSWILLGGVTLAQVTDITPERVEITYGGGMRRSMPIADFLSADVAVLSGGFARSITFGIDYQHLAEASTRVPEMLRADVRAELLKQMPETDLQGVMVEFQEAAASSLNFIIIGLFTGAQAQNYMSLARVLHRAALESCQRHGWSIPFAQLVVHQRQG